MDSTATSPCEKHVFEGKRFLFVTTVPITLTSFLLPFAMHLSEQGARVESLSAGPLDDERLSVFDASHKIGWSRSMSSFTRYGALRATIEGLLEKNHYDIVHVHTPIAALITRRVVARWKKRQGVSAPAVIYTAHGFHFYEHQAACAHALYRTMEKTALKWTDALVVMNEMDERAAHALVKDERPLVARIDGIGLNFERFAPLREGRLRFNALVAETGTDESIDPQPVSLTIIAEHNDNKSVDLLLKSMALLRKQTRVPFVLNVIGSGPLTAQLITLSTSLGLDDVVRFTGQLNQTQLDEYLARTDIGLLVSKREGLPRSLMELCAAGALIAGTKTRGITDEVLDPRALAHARTPHAIASMLQPFVEDPALRHSVAQEQYAHALKTYNLPLILEKYDELYAHYLIDAD